MKKFFIHTLLCMMWFGAVLVDGANHRHRARPIKQKHSLVDAASEAPPLGLRPRPFSKTHAAAVLSSPDEALRTIEKASASSLVVRTITAGGAVANTMPNALLGCLVMALIEQGVQVVFNKQGIKFPAQLGGCLLLFAFLLVIQVTFSFAQDLTISGKVVDAKGEAMLGASVLIEGTSNGVITGLERL